MQLQGIRVIDLTRIVSGPFCTMFLADMGAEVIKIETPGKGDPVRKQGESPNGFSYYFATFNRNKRSLAIDLRSEEGKEVLRKLLASADVVVNNFRPGVMDAMGFGREALRQIKPDLVSCNLTGFGLDGPYAERPSFDFIAQAMSGFMSVNGDEGEPPMRAAPPISDLLSGMYAAMGIMAALLRRDRTGQGEEVTTSLTDSMTSVMSFLASNYFATGKLPARTGNDNALVSPYGMFDAADGQVALAPSNDGVYSKLLTVLGLDHLRERPEFSSNKMRFQNRKQINAEINIKIGEQPIAHWIDVLNQAGVPCGRVLNVQEAFDDPQTQHQQMRITIQHPDHGRLDVLGFPIKFTDDPCKMYRPPPNLGGDNMGVLTELGLSTEAIDALKAKGVI
jgi:crotonobetainyl-CoA:carnitine CoA-transferase CaiB-like acyl-CoA transferase